MDWLAAACRGATPRPGGPPVRVPGDNGLARYRDQKAHGVALFPSIMPALSKVAERFAVAPPQPV